MRPMRSLLFVPGHRETWPAKAVAAGVDGVILDLEDSVPLALKDEGRDRSPASIRALARREPQGRRLRAAQCARNGH